MKINKSFDGFRQSKTNKTDGFFKKNQKKFKKMIIPTGSGLTLVKFESIYSCSWQPSNGQISEDQFAFIFKQR